MKKLLFLLVLVAIVFAGCSSDMDDSLKIKNLSAGKIYMNFRGEVVTVDVGQTAVIKNIPKGTFGYSFTYEIPPNSTGTFTGNATGNLTFKPGTKMTMLFSSTLDGSSYNLYMSLSTSDEIVQQVLQ